jgi:tRNA(Glu) U13 pseudouridine synthase TruD
MTLPGAYRKVVAFPMDVEWKWIDDNSRTPAVDNTKISTSGISYPLEINETKSRDSCIEHPKETTTCVITEKVRERNDTSMSQLDSNRSINDHSIERSYAPCGKRMKLDADSHCIGDNLEISFKLQPSCYATVGLREMMKS